jgi:hypothetical protein
MDIISISALTISIISSIGHFVEKSHLQKCNCLCINSDCIDRNRKNSKTPPESPITKEPDLTLDNNDLLKIKNLLDILDKSETTKI